MGTRNSQSSGLDEKSRRQALWDEANRVVIDATYSGRSHQLMGTTWEKIDRWIGLPSTILSSILAGGAGITALADADTWITATLALVAAILSAVRSFLRSEENADAHGLKGDRFISLRNDAISFQEVDLHSSLSLDALTDRSKNLSERRNALREAPPRHLPRWVYEKTKTSIQNGESDYEDDHLWREGPF